VDIPDVGVIASERVIIAGIDVPPAEERVGNDGMFPISIAAGRVIEVLVWGVVSYPMEVGTELALVTEL